MAAPSFSWMLPGWRIYHPITWLHGNLLCSFHSNTWKGTSFHCSLGCQPRGGASRRKSCVASLSGKIWKDPYCVESIDENYTLSTHFPYTLISPIHTKKWTFKRKHPFHTFYEVYGFNPPFCVYTLPHNFAVSNPPFHTQIWTSWLLHFFLKPPPPQGSFTGGGGAVFPLGNRGPEFFTHAKRGGRKHCRPAITNRQPPYR